MARLFRRNPRLQVGNVVIEDLKISFEISKSTKGLSEQEAKFNVYNLNPQTASLITTAKRGTPIIFDLGHGGDYFNVYKGDIAFASFFIKDQETELFLKGKNLTALSVDVTLEKGYPENTPWRQVIEDLVRACGAGRGNLDVYLPRIRLQGDLLCRTGTAVSGKAWDSLVWLLAAAGLNVQVNDQVLVVSPQDGSDAKVTGQGQVPLISPATGLLGAPKLVQKTTARAGAAKSGFEASRTGGQTLPGATAAGADTEVEARKLSRAEAKRLAAAKRTAAKDQQAAVGTDRVIELQCVIQPGIVPGAKIRVVAALFDTDAVVQSAVWRGSNYGDEYSIFIEAVPVGN